MWNKSEWNRGFQPQKMALSYSEPSNGENCSNQVWMNIRLHETELCRWRIMLQQQICVQNVAVIWGVPWGAWVASGNHQQHLPNAAPSLSASLERLANVMSDEEKGKSERVVQPLNLSFETSVGKAGGTAVVALIIHLKIVQPDSSAFQVCACSCHFRKLGKVLLTRYHNSWKLQVYRSVF